MIFDRLLSSDMTSTNLFRWAGLAAILSGGLAIVLTIPSPDLPGVWIHALQHTLMLLGLTGVYLYQHLESGLLGFVGFILAFAGTASFLVSGQIAGLDSLTIGAVGSGLGFVLLSVGSIKAARFPRPVAWLWIIGAIIGTPASIFVSYESHLLLISAVFFAAGFVGAGLKLLLT